MPGQELLEDCLLDTSDAQPTEDAATLWPLLQPALYRTWLPALAFVPQNPASDVRLVANSRALSGNFAMMANLLQQNCGQRSGDTASAFLLTDNVVQGSALQHAAGRDWMEACTVGGYVSPDMLLSPGMGAAGRCKARRAALCMLWGCACPCIKKAMPLQVVLL